MQRRDFLKIAALATSGIELRAQQPQSFLAPAASEDVAKTDFKLEIGPVTVELAPNRVLSTVGYNGVSPGPLNHLEVLEAGQNAAGSLGTLLGRLLPVL